MLGALIGAGTSLLSGLMGRSDAKRQEQNQREFAQSGIQWKVNDAKKAGIHPLYALGAQTSTYSPVSTGDSLGHIANMGQDISRAVDATRTPTQKLDAYAKTVQDLSLTKMGLENELLASQVAKIKQGSPSAGIPGGDPMLIEGQGNSLGITTNPLERTDNRAGHPAQEPGALPEKSWARTETGWAPIQSKDHKSRTDDDLPATIGWNIRNRLPQSMQLNLKPPFPAPAGKYWKYHPYMQEYRLFPYKERNKWPGTG